MARQTDRSRYKKKSRKKQKRRTFFTKAKESDGATAKSVVLVPDGPLIKGSSLGTIPLSLFIPLSVITLGIYPHIWLLYRVDALAAVGRASIDRFRVAEYCVVGAAAQLVLAAALCALALSAALIITPDAAGMLATAYALAFALIVLPFRQFVLFEIRRQVRRAAFEWDPTGIMLPRTIPSILMMTLFGTAYLQHHINRLIGLGMIGDGG